MHSSPGLLSLQSTEKKQYSSAEDWPVFGKFQLILRDSVATNWVGLQQEESLLQAQSCFKSSSFCRPAQPGAVPCHRDREPHQTFPKWHQGISLLQQGVGSSQQCWDRPMHQVLALKKKNEPPFYVIFSLSKTLGNS